VLKDSVKIQSCKNNGKKDLHTYINVIIEKFKTCVEENKDQKWKIKVKRWEKEWGFSTYKHGVDIINSKI